MPSHTPVTRRDFLKISFTASGALLISACATQTPTPLPTKTALPTIVPTTPPTATPIPEPPFVPNLFVRIDTNGIITLTVDRSEMGQGVRTALTMILADELEADWANVRVEQAPANNELTAGSQTIAVSYTPLREAGARARQMLIAAAAQTWGVSPQECQAEQGAVIHPATGQRLGYGELVAVARNLKMPSFLTQLKNPEAFRLIGTSLPRVDEPAIVTGQAIYGLDVRVPGMLFATIARYPVPGGKLITSDTTAAQAVPGVRQVIRIASGVAVVAENTWAAIQGRAALNATWDGGDNAVFSSESIHQSLARITTQASAQETPTELTTIEAVYETPYLAHAPMEPVNCVADVRTDRCEIWAPTQNPRDVGRFVQNLVSVPTTVHVTLLGGGFGRRLEVDYALEAATLSKLIGAPVQVVWTREDDIQHDFYRQPTSHWLRAGWDKDGQLGLWRHYIAGPGFNGIAYRDGREVLEEGLAVPYAIPNRLARASLANIPLPTGPWRAVMAGPNAFANECFLDEVAAALQQDPYALRMALLPADNRLRPVVELAAAKAHWGTPLPTGRGRGLACHTYRQTSVAMVAEVSVTEGGVRVHKVVCAVDCGVVIHPDMVAQQMEGSIAFGLTSLFKQAITFDQGRVQQSNFHDHPLLRMDEMPEVEVYTVTSMRAPQGVGEMGVPPIVPAVINAIFAVTGIRLRRLPLHPEDLLVTHEQG